MNISSPKFSFSSDFMYMLAPMGHYHHHRPQRIFIFTIRSFTVFYSSSFASKYKHDHIKRLLSVYQDWGQLSDFFFSCQHQAWIDALFFVVANMVNINLGMEVLNIFHYCMDTTEPFVIPCIACLQDIEGIDWKLNIRTRINWYPPFLP